MSKQIPMMQLKQQIQARISKQGEQIPLQNQNIGELPRYKRSILESQSQPQSSSMLSDSQDDNQEKEENDVKDKGTKNKTDAYYQQKVGNSIFKEYFKPDILTKALKRNNIKITDLTITKYNSSIFQKDEDNGQFRYESSGKSSDFLNKQVNLSAIFTLPRIKYSEVEKQQDNVKKDQKKFIGSSFVSFERIKDMNGLLLQSIEHDYCEIQKSLSLHHPSNIVIESKDLFSSKNSNNKSSCISTKSFLENSFSQVGDKSYIKNHSYTNKEKLKYTLQHNKFHENQLKELDQKESLKSMSRLQNIIENQQKIMMKQNYKKYSSSQPPIHQKLQFYEPIQIEQKQENQVKNTEDTLKRQSIFNEQMQMSYDKSNQQLNQQQRSQIFLSKRGSALFEDQKRSSILKRNLKQLTFKETKNEDKKKNLANFYPCYAIQEEYTRWKPEVRELFRIAFNGEYVYMFGGCSSKPMGDMTVFKIQQNEWVHVNSSEDGRYNHMMAINKKNIIIFGGEKFEGQTDSRQKVVTNDTRIFNTDKNEWKYMRPTGDMIEPRRNAACCMLGRYFLVQGGITQKGGFQNDLWTLDIINQRWNSGQCEDKFNYMQEGRAFHKACPVYHPDRRSIELFKEFKDNLQEKQSGEIKHEGIYFFGGQNQNGDANNQLTVLMTNTRPIHFIQPETIGKLPEPRYNHSLNFNSRLRLLVVYGGMNENQTSDQTFYDGLFILQLCDMQWFECATIGGGIQRRANHEAVCFDSQLIIFGGIGENGFFSFEVSKIELDKNKSTSYIIERQVSDKQQQIQSLKRAKTIKSNANIASEKKKEKVKQQEEFIKSLQQEQEGLKNLVEKLNFKNYKSFLPQPVIYKRKRSNSSVYSKEEKLKKDALDEEVNDHIHEDRKQSSIKSCSSPQSTKPPIRKMSLHYSSPLNLIDKSQLLKQSDSQQRKMSSHFKNAHLPTVDLTDQNKAQTLPK